MNALILSGVSWNDTFQRHHQITLELTNRGYEVYFIDYIPSSKFSIKKILKRIKNQGKNCRNNDSYLNDNIHIISSKLLFPNRLTDYLNKNRINNIVSSIPESIDIVVSYLPITTTIFFLDKVKYKKLIYDCVRYFEGWGGYQSNVSRIENNLVLKSDYLLCDSFFLRNHLYKKAGSNEKIYQILPQISNNIECLQPKALGSICTLGYIGTLSSHNDIDLLKRLLLKYKVILYGINEMAELNKYKNFIDKGYYSDLVKLQFDVRRDCDALIIPYTGNMDGVIPAKLPLCISMGLPIFINEFYDSKHLSGTLFVYNNYESLINQIETFKNDVWKKKSSEGIVFLGECKKSDYNNVFNRILRNESQP